MKEQMDQGRIEPEWSQMGFTWRDWTRPGMARVLVVLSYRKSIGISLESYWIRQEKIPGDIGVTPEMIWGQIPEIGKVYFNKNRV